MVSESAGKPKRNKKNNDPRKKRLSEQMAFKNRFDAIKKAAARCSKWIEENFGKDNGAATIALIAPIVDKERDKAE